MTWARSTTGGGPRSSTGHPLAGVRVLGLSDVLGEYCAKLLADLGADVVEVEPPGGKRSRRRGPYRDGSDESLDFVYHNTNKRSVVLDVDTDEGHAKLMRLVARADIVIHGTQSGDEQPIDYVGCLDENDKLIITSIVPFGRRGPYSKYKATDLISFAMGGIMFLSGKLEKAPVCPPSDQAFRLTELHAAYLTLIALYERLKSGTGQHVAISVHEVMASLHANIPRYSVAQRFLRRHGSQTGLVPGRIYECADGYFSIAVFTTPQWRHFVEWLGSPDVLNDPVWDDVSFRLANLSVIDELIDAHCRDKTRSAIVSSLQAAQIPATPANSPGDFFQDHHIRERGAFQSYTSTEGREYQGLGLPFTDPATPGIPIREALAVGSVSVDRVLEDWSGETALSVAPYLASEGRPNRDVDGPLSDIRVVDFSYVWAGPLATRYLADYGAEVVKVESARRPDGRERESAIDPDALMLSRASFHDLNRNKLGVCLDMSLAESRSCAAELIRASDVVVENFSARVMANWGLSYESVSATNARVVMADMQGFGLDGSYRDYLAYGTNLVAFTGMSYVWRHPDDPDPVGSSVPWVDFVAAASGTVGVMAGIIARARGGDGRQVEVAQAEAAACLLGPQYLAYAMNGHEPPVLGNGSQDVGPRGCYPCQGDDRWLAIEVTTDSEWAALAAVSRIPGMAEDPRFATAASRVANGDALNLLLAQWTGTHDAMQLMQALQEAGVPAGVVQTGRDLFEDPQLRATEFIVSLPLGDDREADFPGVVGSLSRTPGAIRKMAPDLGEHTAEVFRRWSDLSEAERVQLVDRGVFV